MWYSSKMKLIALVLIATLCSNAQVIAMPVPGMEDLSAMREHTNSIELQDVSLPAYYDSVKTAYISCSNCTTGFPQVPATDSCDYPQSHRRNRESDSCHMRASIAANDTFCCEYGEAYAVYCSRESVSNIDCECHFNISLLELHTCALYVTHIQ